MMLPPAIMRIRVVENGRKKIGLWLPVFLLWPVLILLAVVSIPLLLVLMLGFWWHHVARKVIRSIPAIFGIICSMRGFAVEVENKEKKEEVIIKIT